jgi:uridine kinase
MRDRPDVASWAEEIAGRAGGLRASLRRTVTVGISGVDCAGKSTLAEALHDRLGAIGVPALVLEGDEFTRPTCERYAEPDEGLGYYRDSFDYGALFERILPAVRSSSPGELRIEVSDWERDGWQERTLVLPAAGVLVVEGCFLFADGRTGEFDLSVWLDLPLDRILARALQRPRDLERMGGQDGVRSRYETRYIAGQRLHLERDRPRERADLVVATR